MKKECKSFRRFLNIFGALLLPKLSKLLLAHMLQCRKCGEKWDREIVKELWEISGIPPEEREEYLIRELEKELYRWGIDAKETVEFFREKGKKPPEA